MKIFIILLKVALSLAAFTMLTACEKGTLRITGYTEDWLQTKSDTKLNFTSNTGQQEEIAVTVKKDTRVYSGMYGDKTYEYYELTYTGKQSDLGIVVLAEHKTISFRSIGQAEFNTNYATLTTGKRPSDETLHRYDVETEFVDKLTLNGVTYDRLVRIKFYLPTDRPDKIKEIYYAKKHGLVYFQTTDGQYWTRD